VPHLFLTFPLKFASNCLSIPSTSEIPVSVRLYSSATASYGFTRRILLPLRVYNEIMEVLRVAILMAEIPAEAYTEIVKDAVKAFWAGK